MQLTVINFDFSNQYYFVMLEHMTIIIVFLYFTFMQICFKMPEKQPKT